MNRTIHLLARRLALMAAAFATPLAAPWCSAASLTLAPSADTYISEHFTGPNGELPDMVIGSQATLSFGATNRGLIRFDVSGIPAGATITSVTLALTVTKSPAGPDSNFHLHRLLRAWDEEQSTWMLRLAPATAWSEDGGGADVDYAAESSSSVHVVGVGSYVVPSSAALIADVTAWVTDPNSNQGWLIKTENETIRATARRFGSRESFSAASLTVEYLPLSIATVQLSAQQLCLGFDAKPGKSYVVERRALIESGLWTEVTNVPPSSTAQRIVVCDPIGPGNGFYRVGER